MNDMKFVPSLPTCLGGKCCQPSKLVIMGSKAAQALHVGLTCSSCTIRMSASTIMCMFTVRCSSQNYRYTGTVYHEICARILFMRIHARHPGAHEYNHTN